MDALSKSELWQSLWPACIPLEYDPDAPTQFSMAAGTYSGESAIAAGLFHNPNKDVLLSVGFSISGSEKAANVGATFRFGRSSESKVRKVIEDKQREQELAAQPQPPDRKPFPIV